MQPYEQLEKELEALTFKSQEYNVVCSSGTAALTLGISSKSYPTRAKIAVPSFAMIACARAVSLSGLNPVFVDVCEDDYNIDPASLRQACQNDDNIIAVLVVHTYGRQAKMEEIEEIAQMYGLDVIEDMAEIHGMLPSSNTEIACWSFYKNKVVCGEEGGCVSFRKKYLADKVRSTRTLGMGKSTELGLMYYCNPGGNNYRMSNVHASLILESLSNMWQNMNKRRELEEQYSLMLKRPNTKRRDSPWVYDLRIKGMTFTDQNKILEELHALNIPARPGFYPLHVQPEYIRSDRYSVHYNNSNINSMIATILSHEIIYLPLDPQIMDSKKVEVVCNRLNDYL